MPAAPESAGALAVPCARPTPKPASTSSSATAAAPAATVDGPQRANASRRAFMPVRKITDRGGRVAGPKAKKRRTGGAFRPGLARPVQSVT